LTAPINVAVMKLAARE